MTARKSARIENAGKAPPAAAAETTPETGFLSYFRPQQAQELAGCLDIADPARIEELRKGLDHAANWYHKLKHAHAPRRSAQRKIFRVMITAADSLTEMLSQAMTSENGAMSVALARAYAGHQTRILDDAGFDDLLQRWEDMESDIQAVSRLRAKLPLASTLLSEGKGQPSAEPLRNLGGRLAFVVEQLTGSDYQNSKRKRPTQARKVVESSIRTQRQHQGIVQCARLCGECRAEATAG
jgi:hypothetical protein